MKIVVDTNILISGIFWGGKPRQILDLWRDERLDLLVTTDILDEYLRVLARIGDDDEDLVSDWTDYISVNTFIVLKTAKTDICRDSDDNKFLECAASANADRVVSGDADFLVLKKFQGIPILKPSAFLSAFG